MGVITDAVHPDVGPYRQIEPATRFSRSPQSVRRHAPLIGEQTRQVLADLGYDGRQIAEVMQSGAEVPMPDELDDYEEAVERADSYEEELDRELDVADAEELVDIAAEGDDTPFDESRQEYTGVTDDDRDVDIEELDEAGALFDDPEREGRETE